MTVINYHYNISGQDDAWAGPHGDNLLKMITCSVFFYIDRYSIERFEAKTPNLGTEAKRIFNRLWLFYPPVVWQDGGLARPP